MIINFKEVLKVSKLVVGDEYFMNSYSLIAMYLGKDSNTPNHFFLPLNGGENVGGILEKKYDIYHYSMFVNNIKSKIENHIPNILSCKLLNTYGRTQSVIRLVQNAKGLSNDTERSILITQNLKNIFKKIKTISSKGSSNRAIANLFLSKLPITLCSINEIGILTIGEDLGNVTLMSVNHTTLRKLCCTNRRVLHQDNISKSFEKVKIGRIVKKVTGDIFTPVEIEKFTHTFNSYLIQQFKYEIEIVKGYDIVKWYDSKFYSNEEKGELQNSCMRYADKCASQIAFYAVHPKCSMVILKKGDKLCARSLLWTLHDGKRYLDRIYSTKNEESAFLFKWSKEQKIEYTYEERGPRGTGHTLFVETPIEDSIFRNTQWPWIDSFRHITKNFKYMVSVGSLKPSSDLDNARKMYYETGVLQCSSAGSVANWIKDNAPSKLRDGYVSIMNYYDNQTFAKLEDCVYCPYDNSYFLKSHCDENGKPLNYVMLKEKFDIQITIKI